MRIPQTINSGSMADIAFLLLIFFMVTTTIQSESGLLRKLPPDIEAKGKIKDRNVLNVMINRNDALMVNGQPCKLSELQDKAVEFIANTRNLGHLPEKSIEDIPPIGEFPVSKQVISLQNDQRTSYGMYVAVQDALTGAYLQVRNTVSLELFNITYEALIKTQDKPKVDAIRQAIPMRISEAEPYQQAETQSIGWDIKCRERNERPVSRLR